eukprot:Lankesteria_metandrocarpae@DN4676_c0_g1_i1.p1
MPMGIKNGCAVFAYWLRGALGRFPLVPDTYRVYVDDLFVSGTSIDDRNANVAAMLRALAQVGVGVNPTKLAYSESGIRLLGMMLQEGVFSIPPAKVQDIVKTIEAAITKGVVTKREVYRILEKVNYFASLSPQQSEVCCQLYEFANTVVPWGELIMLAPAVVEVLRQLQQQLPHWTANSRGTAHQFLTVDTSNVGFGGLLTNDSGEVLRSFSYSHTFSSQDSTWKELRGLYEILCHNRHYFANT